MEDLRKKYAEKLNEMRINYAGAIIAISKKYDKDLGVAFEMLKAIARGNTEYGEGIEVDVEALKKDYAELTDISIQIAEGV